MKRIWILAAILVEFGWTVCIAAAQPAGTLTPTGGMLIPRAWHIATLFPNGKALITGGISQTPTTESLSSAGRCVRGYLGRALYAAAGFVQSAGTVTPAGNMTTPRAYHTATLLTIGTVLIAGVGPSASASAEIYDPSSGNFMQMTRSW